MLFVGILGLLLGILMYYKIYRRYHDVFHPIGVMIVIWYTGSFIASFRLSDFQSEWTIQTSIMILLTGIILYFWTIFRPFIIKFSFEKDSVEIVNGRFKTLSRILFLFCFLACLYSVYVFTQSGIAQTGIDAKKRIQDASQGIPTIILYGNLLLPYSVLCAFFELLYDKSKKNYYPYIVLAYGIFYTWFISKSRGYLSIYMFGILYMVANKNKWKFGKTVKIIAIAVALLSVLMLFRVGRGSSIYTGYFNNPAINATYNYISSSYENLNSIIKDGSHHMPLANTCILLYKLLGIYDASTMSSSVIYQVRGIYNASPLIGYYYFDLGVFGVILGVSFVAWILNYFYHRSKNNIYAILILSMFQKGIFTVCLGDNIFNHGSFSAWLGYFAVILLCTVAQSYHKSLVFYGSSTRSIINESN